MGLVLDAGIEEELRIRHLQVADAMRASLGLPVVEYIVTDTPLEVTASTQMNLWKKYFLSSCLLVKYTDT